VVEGARVRGHRVAACLLAALVTGLLARPVAAGLPGRGSCEGCNVVIVSIDTLRPDRLQPFGYSRPTSPYLSRLAARGIRFERAYSTAATTADAHMSLFTSLYPSVHGVHTGGSPDAVRQALPQGVPTLAGLLRDRGYATAGFHNGGNVSPDFGFDRGFDVYERAPFMTGLGWKATRDWLAETQQPFFLFLHTYHVHDPYTPDRSARERFAGGYEGPIISDRRKLKRMVEETCADDPDCSRFRLPHRIYWSNIDREGADDVAHLSDLYDGEIREVDQALPLVMETLERVPGDTLVLILSDHGEAFGEHGVMMHSTLHEEVLRIPLLVLHPRAPDRAGRRYRAPTSLMNVSPLVLGWLSVDAPPSFQAGLPHEAQEILAESHGADQLALVRGGMKILLRGRGGPTATPAAAEKLRRVASAVGVDADRFRSVELFDLARDPGEQHDLGPPHPEFEPMLRAALLRVVANREHRASLGLVPASPSALSDDTRHQLEALGYLE
jgi:arylsulfatase A-like enzyme